MKTKQLPAIVMLAAGFITCIAAIFQRLELGEFLKMLLLVLVSFYILGGIIKIILDRSFAEKQKEEIQSEEDTKPEDTDKREQEAEREKENVGSGKADKK